MIELSVATIADMEKIAALHIQSWQQTYRGILSDSYLDDAIHHDQNKLWQHRFANPAPRQVILVAYEGKNLLGFICIYLEHHPKWGTLVENLHISGNHQGQGLGKRLLFAAAAVSYAHLPSNGMYLEVLADNITAQIFYQKLGALKAKAQTWQAPDGNRVNELIYRWNSIEHLVKE
ncbi:GNAT family N-acetyltransferase [Photobacterium sp. SDRW27]|uniref:GNAT family N-acetyltransferase n=1 Tax=Photobacterium obscurum TaxID=2829490 RepID=UPI002244BC17|nr:GNAT family N-acetyltransferase [Photobacterium obscurum]MCW8331008.1 GNAT family N-acetyltransferase [Photobacterium obscurum]